MKNFTSFSFALILSAISIFSFTSCEDEMATVASKEDVNLDWRTNPNSAIYPPNARPYGKSYVEWTIEMWSIAFQLDCEAFGQVQMLTIDENVVSYLGPLATAVVNITISKDQVFLLPLITAVYDYPCPEIEFEPAPGQSLEDFLQENFTTLMDMVENTQISLDGNLIEDINDFRFMSDLFYFTGNPELAECYDPCVTGTSQPGVTGGYIVMFKKFQPGLHVINYSGSIPLYELEWDITLNITVE